jgi:hypothetical protein
MREGAGVMGYRSAGKLELLRAGKNGMLCLADDPAEAKFHVSCYADTMEPFMARGRALRASGTTGAKVDTARFAEVKAGKLKMPTQPAALYQIFADEYDAATGTVKNGRQLFVVYTPFATPETTGLSTTPSDSKPWLMLPGTPAMGRLLLLAAEGGGGADGLVGIGAGGVAADEDGAACGAVEHDLAEPHGVAAGVDEQAGLAGALGGEGPAHGVAAGCCGGVRIAHGGVELDEILGQKQLARAHRPALLLTAEVQCGEAGPVGQ